MVTEKKGTAPFMFAGILVGACFPLVLAIAVFADGNWQFDVNTLSDLGISRTALAANLFNIGCMVSGILVILFSLGKLYIKNGADSASAFVLALGGVLLFGIGIFSKNYDIHNLLACSFFFLVAIAMIISAISDWKHGRKITTAITIVVIATVIACLPGFSVAGIEAIFVIGCCLWLIGQSMSLGFSKD
jgi:hypothetical membrane protein